MKISMNDLNKETLYFKEKKLKNNKVKETFEEADNNLITVSPEELSKYLKESIEEAMTTGSVMRSGESKRAAAVAAIAVSLAKKNNDPLYDLLKRHRGAWKRIKDDVISRYRGQAEMKLQQNMSKR